MQGTSICFLFLFSTKYKQIPPVARSACAGHVRIVFQRFGNKRILSLCQQNNQKWCIKRSPRRSTRVNTNANINWDQLKVLNRMSVFLQRCPTWMRRASGRFITQLHGTSRRTSSFQAAGRPAWKTFTVRPKSTLRPPCEVRIVETRPHHERQDPT